MKVSLFIPAQGPGCDRALLSRIGPLVEARGFDGVWLGEHVVLFEAYRSRYPYADDGRIPVSGQRGLLEPMTTLAFLAATTERIRLGTGICLVPQRNPVYTAKEVANLDWISNGRVDFGVGIGWLAEEFAAVQAPWAQRAARCHSYLNVMRTLWTDEVSAYSDDFYQLPACVQLPKPIQKPHPPILFGGESDAALDRVVQEGDGWYGFNLSPAAFADRVKQLGERLDRAGRERSSVRVVVAPYQHPLGIAELEAYHRAGADEVVAMALATDVDRFSQRLDRLSEGVLARAHALGRS